MSSGVENSITSVLPCSSARTTCSSLPLLSVLYDCLHCCRKALWLHDVCLVNRWLQLKLQLPQEMSGCSKACVNIAGC